IFKKSRDGSKDKRKEILKEEADQAIASFFYSNAIPLKVVESKAFIAMVDMISRCGVGFEPPSVEDISGKYLTEHVRLTNEALEEHRSVWKKTGCSIMVDG
ncbi:HAT family dimerization domain containing protein, partial [Trifolium medium]|nr:HAT family dimerization domain containing protein [Trifolium medium]